MAETETIKAARLQLIISTSVKICPPDFSLSVAGANLSLNKDEVVERHKLCVLFQ